MRTSKHATSDFANKRTLSGVLAAIGAAARRLVLAGISARAQAITGNQPRQGER